jgi:hypothetical protein
MPRVKQASKQKRTTKAAAVKKSAVVTVGGLLPVYPNNQTNSVSALLSIALDGSYTHMYASGTRRHINGALKAGATMEEIMEVLKLCVAQGVQACNLGVPILAEEIAAVSKAVARP